MNIMIGITNIEWESLQAYLKLIPLLPSGKYISQLLLSGRKSRKAFYNAISCRDSYSFFYEY